MNAKDGPAAATRVILGTMLSATLFCLLAVDFFLRIDVIFPSLVLTVLAWGLWEYYILAEKSGFYPYKQTAVATGVVFLVAVWLAAKMTQLLDYPGSSEQSWLSLFSLTDLQASFNGRSFREDLMFFASAVLVLSLMALSVFVLSFFKRKTDASSAVGRVRKRDLLITAAGFFYVFLLGTFVFAHRYSFLPLNRLLRVADNGLIFVFLFLATVKSGDIAAYTIGRLFGKHPLMPRVSPNKTVEGSAAALVASVVVALLFWALVHALSRWETAVVYGVLVSVAAQSGDLLESKIKRVAREKDSSNLLPTFGGVLDFIDSLLLAAPVSFSVLLCDVYLFRG